MILSIHDKIKKLRATCDVITGDKQLLEKEYENLSNELLKISKARVIIQKAAKMTQEHLEVHFGNIVSKALLAVFPEPYVFVPEFVERRNKVECDLWFERNGSKMQPKFASGGGAVDIAAFALRMAYIKMESDSLFLLLDEPFKMLSKDMMTYASRMLSVMSEKLKFQIIMITHSTELEDCADKLFKIKAGKLL